MNVLENVLNNLPALAVFMCYLLFARSADAFGRSLPWTKCIGIVFFITATEVVLTLFPLTGAHMIFRWLSGFASGVALALFVGRIDSKLIGPPIWVTALLYFYAVIQGGFAEFHDARALTIVLMNVALILKLVLYLFVFWLLDNGTLLFYFESVRTEAAEIAKRRTVFLDNLRA